MWPFSSPYPELGVNHLLEEYDFIVVGGGTAGCVLANRLSADPSISVLLVERGSAEDTWVSRVPLLSLDFTTSATISWNQNSVPQEFTDGRTQELVSGRGLGGTSRINSMIYTRGLAAEYNAWGASGRRGWTFDDVLPLFMRSECCLNKDSGRERGQHGEWATRRNGGTYFKVAQRVIDASQKLGFKFIKDVNSSTSAALGCAQMDFTVDSKGYRQSTFSAFLPATLVRKRMDRLHVCTDALVTKLHYTCTAAVNKVVGVYVQSMTKSTPEIRIGARCEVILCCGALGSPQVLQLSGIGPRQLLEELGIPVIKDLPGVGMHLQDHLGVPLVFNVPIEDSLVSVESQILTFVRELAKYLTLGTGLLSFPVLGLAIFARTDLLDAQSHLHACATQLDAHDPVNRPDIEIMPVAYDVSGVAFDKNEGAFTFLNILLRPESTGSVHIVSTDARDPVACDLGYLSSAKDLQALRASLRLSLALAREIQAKGYHCEAYHLPNGETDAALDAYVRKWTKTTYHYSSTCRMAPEDDAAPGVVDDELRVHGLRGLRIADSSIFPEVLGSHLQAPVVMVAERCADILIKLYCG